MIQCPYCQQPMQTVPQLAGQVVSCPRCRGQLTMPAVEPAFPTVSPSRSSSVPRRKGSDNTLLIIGGVGLAIVAVVGLVLVIDQIRIANFKRQMEPTAAQKRVMREAQANVQQALRDAEKLQRDWDKEFP